MSVEAKDIEALVEAMAAAMGLDIPPVGKAVVAEHLKIAYAMAPLVLDMPLEDEAEPAPVFTP